jgi:hypothetical protein
MKWFIVKEDSAESGVSAGEILPCGKVEEWHGLVFITTWEFNNQYREVVSFSVPVENIMSLSEYEQTELTI